MIKQFIGWAIVGLMGCGLAAFLLYAGKQMSGSWKFCWVYPLFIYGVGAVILGLCLLAEWLITGEI